MTSLKLSRCVATSVLGLVLASWPVKAADQPRADEARMNVVLITSDDLRNLRRGAMDIPGPFAAHRQAGLSRRSVRPGLLSISPLQPEPDLVLDRAPPRYDRE